MDKGIRPACNAKFVELNEQRRRGLMGNTVFRKSVIAWVMEEFGCTLASAATHYNHAFKLVKELNSELVDGLGRPEDKKGGRKPKAKSLNITPEAAQAAVDGIRAAAAALTAKELCAPVEQLDPMPEEQTVYQVRSKKDDTVLCEGLSFEDAREMVRSGRHNGKFQKMYWL